MKAIYFSAPWCVPCKTFGPVMEKVTALPVVKVNVDDNTTMTTAYNVYSVPTVIVVAEDGSELGRFMGARDAEFVNRFLASHS